MACCCKDKRIEKSEITTSHLQFPYEEKNKIKITGGCNISEEGAGRGYGTKKIFVE